MVEADVAMENSGATNAELVVAMAKTSGVASALSNESKALMGDISRNIATYSTPGLDSLQNIIGDLVPGLNKGSKVN